MSGPVTTFSDLPEFLATVTTAQDPQSALRAGVARIAETFDAEVVAVVHEGQVISSVGFPRGDDHHRQLREVASGALGSLDIPTIGPTEASAVHLHTADCVVIVAREGEPLDRVELAHAQAMARILALALDLLESAGRERSLRLLTEEKIRENEQLLEEHRAQQRVLEAILRIQRLISQRRPVDAILQAITGEAAALLGADIAGVCLAASDGASHRALATGSDLGDSVARAMSETGLHELGRRAADGRLVTPRKLDLTLNKGPMQAVAIGAPVYDDGSPIGGFFVVKANSSATGDDIDAAAVQTFASQASIALTDASTLDELHHASHDLLTGLPNRALFQERFEQALDRAGRNGTTTALLFLDLDRFKAVNDNLGHAAGDALLKEIGARLADVGRLYETVARIGGDEFAIVLEDASRETAEAVAERLLSCVGEAISPVGTSGSSSASIGIALGEGGSHTTDELLRRADIAMYKVKAAGRAGKAVYDDSMGATRLDQNAVAEALQVALVGDQFVVHYQPILCLRTRTITGVEALVRWQHPDRGLLFPGDFIEAAEETGMIVPIGRRVLAMACQQTSEWRRAIPAACDLSVSVNLSGRQLEEERCARDVARALEDSGLDPSALTLEVTESIFAGDAEVAGARLRTLKDLGISLAVDDFGTGFSSLSYVHNYPFDVLKIDRSFVQGLGTAANRGAIVKTMVALGQEMSMKVVAEGIEELEELAQLRALRCSHGQGFLFSRPIAPESFAALMSSAPRMTEDVVAS